MDLRACCRRSVTVTAVALLAVGLASPTAAFAQPQQAPFADADDAAIAPGALMITPISGNTASGCTAAFVFASDDAVYLGYAAHCAGNGVMGLSGCEEPTLPLGSPVLVEGDDGGQRLGRLAYSSWVTMQERGEDDDLCFLNDFALVELDPDDVGDVTPTVPRIGGPTGLDVDGSDGGEFVVSYQPNRSGDAIKDGRSLGDQGGGRTHRVVTEPPGNAGDSGAGYLDGQGEAFGVLSTQITGGGRTANGVTDLALALEYANRFGELDDVSLVAGTEPFRGEPGRSRVAGPHRTGWAA